MGSTQAQNYHSITFGAKNSWDDWHLIPTTRPEFSTPKGRTIFAEIPGHAGGGIDISEILTGKPMYENRKGSFQFASADGYGNWYDRYQAVRSYLHGKRMQAILDDEPEYYYEGRFKVKDWVAGKVYSTITIEYSVDPYKRTVDENSVGASVSGQTTLIIHNLEEIVIPTIVTSTSMQCTLNGTQFSLASGSNKNPLMALRPGDNTLIVRGNGTIAINYRGGML